jgi:hypothetical protein
MEIMKQERIKIKRAPGANIKICFETNAFPFKFVISNGRLNRNIFDVGSWFLRIVLEHNGAYLFCFHRDYKRIENNIHENEQIKRCLYSFSKNSIAAKELGGIITCYYSIGNLVLTLPNMEWWNYNDLINDFEEIKKWYSEFFLA